MRAKETKELINAIKYNEMLSPEICEEIIQSLMEYEELKKELIEISCDLDELIAQYML